MRDGLTRLGGSGVEATAHGTCLIGPMLRECDPVIGLSTHVGRVKFIVIVQHHLAGFGVDGPFVHLGVGFIRVFFPKPIGRFEVNGELASLKDGCQIVVGSAAISTLFLP
jgi:hypothetical protein